MLYRLVPVACVAVYIFGTFSSLYNGQPCLFSQHAIPEFAMKLGDCECCKNVGESLLIEDISPEEFMSKYAYSTKPLLMKGAASNWPAMDVFTFKYFQELYSKNPKSLENDATKGQFFAYSSGMEDINELMRKLDDDQSYQSKWYIGW